jgi:starch synthase
VQVVHNGIDSQLYRPVEGSALLDSLGVDRSRPIVAFVGRITRQKGVPHLLRAARHFVPEAQLVLVAGAPDTPELAAETASAVEHLRATRDGVTWLTETLDREAMCEVLGHATVFVCPSIYEPLGIVNLEAMACATAVVASDVGGIPEVVDDGVTGLLAHYDAADPAAFEAALAAHVNVLVADPARAARMGHAGRQRAVAEFGWDAIARKTLSIYEALGAR